MKRRDFLRLFGLAPLAIPLGCSREPRIQTQGFLLYGMLIQLSLPEDAPIGLEAALNAVEAIFKREYAALHPWQDSPLTRLNARLPDGDWTALDPALRGIIERGRALETASGGAFSPAIGALVKLWGFHASQPNREREPPPQTDIERLLTPPPRMSDLVIEEGRIRCTNPNVLLDFNAVAEGWAAEQAIQRLRALGVEQALLDAGGDLRVLGKAGRRPWRVAIQDPFVEQPLGWIEVEGEAAVFTSGSYRKRFTYQGASYAHVIDPRSGWPSRGLVGVTVMSPDAVLADAAATALLAAGRADAPAVIQRMGLKHVLLVEDDGKLRATAAMARKLQLLRQDRPLSILTP
ncbi:MAG: FAD:protein FMN transferase [Pseudomonadota bacterium]